MRQRIFELVEKYNKFPEGTRIAIITGIFGIMIAICSGIFVVIAAIFSSINININIPTPIPLTATFTPPPTDIPSQTLRPIETHTQVLTETPTATLTLLPTKTPIPPTSIFTLSPTPTPSITPLTQRMTQEIIVEVTPTPISPALILFPEEKALTIFVASAEAISLAELKLTVVIDSTVVIGGIEKNISPFNDFDILQLLDGMAQPGMCFRYLAPNHSGALQSDCSNNRQLLFDKEMARADVFWYDESDKAIRSISVSLDGNQTYCGSDASCEILTPTAIFTSPPTNTTTWTATASDMPTLTPSVTPTATYTSSPTNTPSETSTATYTLSPSATTTFTPIPTATETITPIFTDVVMNDKICIYFEPLGQPAYAVELHDTEVAGIIFPTRGKVTIYGAERVDGYADFRYEGETYSFGNFTINQSAINSLFPIGCSYAGSATFSTDAITVNSGDLFVVYKAEPSERLTISVILSVLSVNHPEINFSVVQVGRNTANFSISSLNTNDAFKVSHNKINEAIRLSISGNIRTVQSNTTISIDYYVNDIFGLDIYAR